MRPSHAHGRQRADRKGSTLIEPFGSTQGELPAVRKGFTLIELLACQPKLQRRQARGAFTLIELLVVIAVIALLVSIIVPSLGRAKRLAREAICATRIHNLSLSTNLWAIEHGGKLPNMGTSSTADDAPEVEKIAYYITSAWRDALVDEYGHERDAFYSPSNDIWNSDEFWNFRNGSLTVMGFFYWGNRPGLEKVALPGIKSLSDPNVTAPLFPETLHEVAYMPYLWTDLNRRWAPNNNKSKLSFVHQPPRWGANHLYVEEDGIVGSHAGRIDGSVEWLSGAKVKPRFHYIWSEYWW